MGFTIYATPGTYDFLREYDSLYNQEDEERLPKGCAEEQRGSTRTKPSTPGTEISNTAEDHFGEKLFKVHKPESQQQPNAVEIIESNNISIVINISGSLEARSSGSAGYQIRRAAVNSGGKRLKKWTLLICKRFLSVSLITDLKVAQMFVEALTRLEEAQKLGKAFWEIRSWDEYVMNLSVM